MILSLLAVFSFPIPHRICLGFWLDHVSNVVDPFPFILLRKEKNRLKIDIQDISSPNFTSDNPDIEHKLSLFSHVGGHEIFQRRAA